MADDIFKWICNISALNDEQLKQEIKAYNQTFMQTMNEPSEKKS
jgi:hypothetical protein